MVHNHVYLFKKKKTQNKPEMKYKNLVYLEHVYTLPILDRRKMNKSQGYKNGISKIYSSSIYHVKLNGLNVSVNTVMKILLLTMT